MLLQSLCSSEATETQGCLKTFATLNETPTHLQYNPVLWEKINKKIKIANIIGRQKNRIVPYVFRCGVYSDVIKIVRILQFVLPHLSHIFQRASDRKRDFSSKNVCELTLLAWSDVFWSLKWLWSSMTDWLNAKAKSWSFIFKVKGNQHFQN